MAGQLHRSAGCTLFPSRFYVFDADSGAQIVDQPLRGFPDSVSARAWLSDSVPALRAERFVVAQGRDVQSA